MLKRTLTAIIGIPFLLYIILYGDWVLRFAIIAFSVIGVYELYNAFSNKYNPMKSEGYIFALLIGWASLYTDQPLEIYLGLLIVGVLVRMVTTYPKYTIIDASITVFGILYIPFLFPFVARVRNMPMGEFFVWLIFISAWGTDTFAYFSGYFFGKSKLAPKLSPKKTREGAIGGIIGAALLSLLYGWIYGTYYNPEVLSYLLLVPILTGFSSVVAQIGDLSASAIKRFLGTKDFGNILPGHGGVLDRFDSVLFVAPFIYTVLYLLL